MNSMEGTEEENDNMFSYTLCQAHIGYITEHSKQPCKGIVLFSFYNEETKTLSSLTPHTNGYIAEV